jgi:hypothetical protein
MAIEVGKTYRTRTGSIVTITGKPIWSERFPFLGDNESTYTTEGTYLELGIHDLDLVEEVTGFRTQQEVWGYLAGGGYITYEDKLLGFHEGSLSLFSIYGELLNIDMSWRFDYPEDWSIGFIQSKPEPKWYDNIPEQGILCWVKEEEEDEAKLTTIIEYHRYESKYTFESLDDYWKHATPVTLEEIANYIYECE